MQYPLEEKIGNPDLFVGRAREFKNFGQWLAYIPEKISKSRVILARRKSGKTAFVQRVFNQLWSQNGAVIPFYFSVPESNVWYPDFARNYYRAFASQFISFRERVPELVSKPLSLEQIRAYGVSHSIKGLVEDVDSFATDFEQGSHDLMWFTACNAPHRFAAVYDLRFLVIIDEFQYVAQHIYRDEACATKPDTSMPGSWHTLSESKIAPMLVTGSYISWLIDISRDYLEAGRLTRWYMTSSLTPDEGLQTVYKYAEICHQPITNETAVLINQLCLADAFFISCVIQSNYEGKALDTVEGVINTVDYEIVSPTSELSGTWAEYIYRTLARINDIHSKQMLLHLSKYSDRAWTHHEIKTALQLELPTEKILERLRLLVKADLLSQGWSDIRFQGLQDGTLYLILRHHFEEEISSFIPDFRQDFRHEVEQLQRDKQQLQGKLNQLSGKMAEYQLATAFRSQKRFALSKYFKGVTDKTRLNMTHVQLNVILQRPDGKVMELDVVAKSSDGRVVLVEVKKLQSKIGAQVVLDFQDKVTVYQQQYPPETVLPAILSLGGFTAEAKALCQQYGIAIADRMVW